MSPNKSRIPDRSPVILRSQSQKLIDVSQTIKTSQTTKLKFKVSPANSKTQNVSSASELPKLKIMIGARKGDFDEKIINLRTEMDIRHSKYDAIFKSFEKDTQQIKNKQSEVSEMLYSLNATRFNFILSIGFNKPANVHHNFDYFDDIEDLNIRIVAIESNIVKIDRILVNLSEAAANSLVIRIEF